MLRASSSTSSTVGRPDPRRSCCSRSSMRCFSAGRSVTTRCRNSAVSSSSRSGDSTPLTTMLRAMVCSCASSSADSSRAGEHDDRHVATAPSSSRMLLQHLEAGHVGQPQVEHHAVARAARAASSSAAAPVSAVDDLDVVVAEQLRDAHLLGRDCPRRPAAACGAAVAYSLIRDSAALDALGRRRLGDEGERAARQAVLAVLVERDDLHRDVPRQRVLLELAEHGPAEHVGQEHVERDRRRLVLLGEVERIGAAHRDQHLEALVAREVDHDARIVRIVLDDQQHGVAGLRSSAGRPAICSIGALRRRADGGDLPASAVPTAPASTAARRSGRHSSAADRA